MSRRQAPAGRLFSGNKPAAGSYGRGGKRRETTFLRETTNNVPFCWIRSKKISTLACKEKSFLIPGIGKAGRSSDAEHLAGKCEFGRDLFKSVVGQRQFGSRLEPVSDRRFQRRRQSRCRYVQRRRPMVGRTQHRVRLHLATLDDLEHQRRLAKCAPRRSPGR